MAQQTIFTLPANTQIAAGTTTSPTFTFPTNISSVTTQFNISATDAADATKQMTFSLLRESSPGSGVFVFDHGFTWQGGSTNPKTGQPFQPSITVDVGPLAGVLCEVQITVNEALSLGATVTAV